MLIKTYIESDYKIVEIVGPLQRNDDNEIIQALSQPLVKKVSFINIFIVTEQVVRKLVELCQEKAIRITSNEIFLSTYLNKLELRTLHVKDSNLFCRLKALSQTRMIVLTGSADSTDKIKKIITQLPLFPHLSICIVQHIPRDGKLIQDSLWQALTNYKVQYAKDGMEINGGVIYLARPDHHLRIKNGAFTLTQDEDVCYARPSIDVILSSIADEYGPSGLGIILCGYSSDGVQGSKYATSKDMPIIIEDEEECEAKDLLKNIKKNGKFHIEATVEKINQLLPLFTTSDEDLLQEYFKAINTLYEYNFRNYILESVERRIDATVAKYNCLSRRHFFISSINHKQKFMRLLMELSISTTHFFREPNTWRYIKDEILPKIGKNNHVKIWSAGSSTGKEAYSMAILAQHENILQNCLIYGTDINKNSLTIANNGLYSLTEVQEFETNLQSSLGKTGIKNYIHREDRFFSMDSVLSDHVFFFRHNLVMEESMNVFHLILCNNVLIYFNSYLRDSVLQLLKNSLTTGGYLIIGENENISGLQQEHYFKTLRKNVFQKI